MVLRGVSRVGCDARKSRIAGAERPLIAWDRIARVLLMHPFGQARLAGVHADRLVADRRCAEAAENRRGLDRGRQHADFGADDPGNRVAAFRVRDRNVGGDQAGVLYEIALPAAPNHREALAIEDSVAGRAGGGDADIEEARNDLVAAVDDVVKQNPVAATVHRLQDRDSHGILNMAVRRGRGQIDVLNEAVVRIGRIDLTIGYAVQLFVLPVAAEGLAAEWKGRRVQLDLGDPRLG